ncbi:hypothetical protein RJ641_031907 [Dillenia turbinata]|uniref:Uncharacterized protein n=1 Tax=Dillenia turbinata TaxID=194707 RepID=A0AAN8ZF03_9MAGN
MNWNGHRTKSVEEEDEENGQNAVRLATVIMLPMVLKSTLELNLVDIILSATAQGGAGAYVSESELADRKQCWNRDGSNAGSACKSMSIYSRAPCYRRSTSLSTYKICVGSQFPQGNVVARDMFASVTGGDAIFIKLNFSHQVFYSIG